MTWNKESVYDDQIYPLMAQIIDICKEHELPIVCTVQFADTEEDGPCFCTTTLTHWPHTDNKMRRLNVAHHPERAVAFAETITTQPDGSKAIKIQRIA